MGSPAEPPRVDADTREQGFARALERSKNEIYVFADADLRFMHANEGAQRNVGFTMEELMTRTPVDLKPEFTLESFTAMVEKLRSGEEQRLAFETVHRRKDGSLYPVDIHLELTSFEGAPAFVAIIQDISERRRLERDLAGMNERLQDLVDQRTAELKDAQAALVRKERLTALGQLAGGVAHEIRTPLGVIQNAAYYLRMRAADLDAEMLDAVHDIETGVTSSEAILREMLNYGRASEAETSAFPVAEVVDDALSALSVPTHVLVLRELDATMEDVVVQADRGQIERVLVNLVRNAIQAMSAGGTVVVRGTADEAAMTLAVVDTGPGLSPEQLEKVFEPLYTTKRRGIGLGLSVARRYAEVNGGSLTVQSRSGEGARFQLVLPVHSTTPQGRS